MGEVKKDEVVDRFETYEEYLNMFITEDDMLYLGEEEIARNIIAGFDDVLQNVSCRYRHILIDLLHIKIHTSSFSNLFMEDL